MRYHTKQLIFYGVTGGSIAVGAFYYSVKYVSRGILERSEYAMEAREIFYNCQEAKNILGTPIIEGRIDPFDIKNNFTNGYEALVSIPVKGKNTEGFIVCTAEKRLRTGLWYITSLHLRTGEEPPLIFEIIKPRSFMKKKD